MRPARNTRPGQGTPHETLAMGPCPFLAAGWALLGGAASAAAFAISTIPAPPPWGRAYSIPLWLEVTQALLAIIMVPVCAVIPVPLLITGRRRLRGAVKASLSWNSAWTAAASAAVLVEAMFLYRLARLLLMLGSFPNLPTPSWHALAFAIAYITAGLMMVFVLMAAGESGKAIPLGPRGTQVNS